MGFGAGFLIGCASSPSGQKGRTTIHPARSCRLFYKPVAFPYHHYTAVYDAMQWYRALPLYHSTCAIAPKTTPPIKGMRRKQYHISRRFAHTLHRFYKSDDIYRSKQQGECREPRYNRIQGFSCFASVTGKGRGPINAISPRITLYNCGNSSSPVWLKNLPTPENRGSL